MPHRPAHIPGPRQVTPAGGAATRRRHAQSEIAAKLKEAEALAAEGRTQSQIAQALGISVMTFHRWRKARPHSDAILTLGSVAAESAPNPDPPYPSDSGQAKRLAELQLENTRLRKLVTDLLLEKITLEDEMQTVKIARSPEKRSR